METPRFGTLVVVVDKARNLPNRKRIGKQDAYAIVRLGHEVQRTPTDKRAGQVPSWNHEIRFKVPNEAENILKISVFNEDSKTPDLIGDCSVDLTDLYRKHEFDSWFDLKYKDKPAGELYAELTFYYEGPPKPKPKVQLNNHSTHHTPSGSLNNVSFARHLPVLPTASDLMHPSIQSSVPSSVRRMSAVSTGPHIGMDFDRNFADAGNDPAYASPATNQSYLPPQTGVAYAETWDGTRDNRVYRLAPGDMRRKSVPNVLHIPDPVDRDFLNVYSDLRIDEQQPRRRVMGPRQNLMGIRPMPSQSGQSNHVHAAHFHHESQSSTMNNYNPAYNEYASSLPSQALMRSSSPERTAEIAQYVEPILDPRHGSVHQLRDSPLIADVNHNIVSGSDSDHQNLATKSFLHSLEESESLETHCTQLDYHNGNHLLPPRNHSEPEREKLYCHGQAQPVSYLSTPYDERPGSRSNNHNKAASTATLGPASRSKMYQQHHSGHGRSMTNGSDYVQAINHQSPATYAVTPAEYHSRERPLPPAPHAPPSLPAKIPLGLTQAEYDILYER